MERKKAKTSPKSKNKPKPENGLPMPSYGVKFEQFWTDLMQYQEINERQIEESSRKFQKKMEERTRHIRESDSKFQLRFDEKGRQLRESEDKLDRQLEEKRQKFHDEQEKVAEIYSENTGETIEKKTREDQANGLLITWHFSRLGYHFDDVSSGGRKILDEKGNIKAEIGIILESPGCVLAIDKKTKPKKKDIDAFINRLSILREHRNKYNDRRKIHGAIMGKIFNDDEKEIIQKAGFFAIEQNGNSIKINAPESLPHEL